MRQVSTRAITTCVIVFCTTTVELQREYKLCIGYNRGQVAKCIAKDYNDEVAVTDKIN